MDILPNNSTCLELTMGIPGLSSSSSGKEMDINKGCMEEIEEDHYESPINGCPAQRKKLRLTKRQSLFLEQSFTQNQTLNPKEKETLAMNLKVTPRQVEVWFQNRRTRSRLKQTKVECEYLKRRFESLSEQNMKLHKEVEELKAIKVGPPHGCYPSSAICALTMCPHCECIMTTTTTTTTHLDKGSTTFTIASASNLPFLQLQKHYASCYN